MVFSCAEGARDNLSLWETGGNLKQVPSPCFYGIHEDSISEEPEPTVMDGEGAVLGRGSPRPQKWWPGYKTGVFGRSKASGRGWQEVKGKTSPKTFHQGRSAREKMRAPRQCPVTQYLWNEGPEEKKGFSVQIRESVSRPFGRLQAPVGSRPSLVDPRLVCTAASTQRVLLTKKKGSHRKMGV